MRRIVAAICAIGLSGCITSDDWGDYAARKDTITLGAGNAKEVNANQHIIDPWPPYVGDKRIPGNGARTVKAIECYEGTAAAAGGPSNSGSGTQVNIGGGAATGATTGCNRPPIRPVIALPQ